MEMNELVAQLKDDHDSYGQWLYFLSIYGDPGSGQPWGWQIDGHHLCIATVVFDGYGDTDAFYYRVHSPVTLIEFDHQDGVVFDNVDPSRHHIHMLVRTPNGGDYGPPSRPRPPGRTEHGIPQTK